MEYYKINLNRVNLRSADIIYIYANGEGDRYSKTERGIINYHTHADGSVTVRVVPPDEMDQATFDSLKAISDEEYQSSNTINNRECWNVVSLTNLENSDILEQEESVEHTYFRSLEDQTKHFDAIWDYLLYLLNHSGLTEVQKRRYLKYHYENKTTRVIAQGEGVGQSKICKSLVSAQKKIDKTKKFMKRT